jgi:hypothetical protein
MSQIEEGSMRLLILMMLALACAGQTDVQNQAKLMATNGQANGLFWQSSTRGEKLMYIGGFGAGTKSRVLPGGELTCESTITWAKTGSTNEQLISTIDEFYKSAPNLPFPMDTALVYSLAKLRGVSADELQQYRITIMKSF